MSTQIKDVDNYISAGSLKGLRRIMRKVNSKYHVQHIFRGFGNYVDQKGKTVFYAWYEPTEAELRNEIDGN